jgi:uncharacterized membrane protein YdjX (TVP38/TMEM64 family)
LEKVKKVLMVVWGLLIVVALGLYFIYPENFSREAISTFIQRYENQMFLLYLVISVVRGMFLIPSTAFVLAGVIIFPDSPWTVLVISMIGVLAGAAMIFYFTEFLGFEKFFQKRFANKMDRVHRGMEKYGIWIVATWAFFPVVPTDLVAYVAGVVRMKPWKFFLGILIGELPLVSLYVFGGNAVSGWLF